MRILRKYRLFLKLSNGILKKQLFLQILGPEHIFPQIIAAIRAANKIKNKYKKKILGKKKIEKDSLGDKCKKTSADWLRIAGYMDTKEQDAVN